MQNLILFSMVFISLSPVITGQRTLDISKLTTDINKGGGSTITTEEIKGFYSRMWGTDASRCAFTDQMLKRYTSDAVLTSILFDVIKDNSGTTLRETDFVKALLGGANEISLTSFQSNFEKLLTRASSIDSLPHEESSGPGLYNIEDFTAGTWADLFDTNADGLISSEEISRTMNTKVDLNGDDSILRCEFVDALQTYKQHPAVSSKVYDVMFQSRDVHWADVDSQFLLRMIDDNVFITSDQRVQPAVHAATKEEFIHFFTYNNLKAAGLDAWRDGTLVHHDGAAGLMDSSRSFLWITGLAATVSAMLQLMQG